MEGIWLANRSQRFKGTLKISSSGMRWSAGAEGVSPQNVPAETIEKVEWAPIGGGKWELRVHGKEGLVRFQGFGKTDATKVGTLLQNKLPGVSLGKKELVVKGWNWGNFELNDAGLQFSIDDKFAFDLDCDQISQAVPNKAELSLALKTEDSRAQEDSLCDIRIAWPLDSADPQSDVASFHKEILERVKFGSDHGKPIASFPELMCHNPRGKYSFDFFRDSFLYYGKTYRYKINYSQVRKLFMLHRPDSRFIFVLSLHPAIRQGATSYPYILVQIPEDSESDITINLPEEELEGKYKGTLSKAMEGPTHDVFPQMFQALAGKKIIISGNFVSGTSSSSKCLQCSLGANLGYLFPLGRSFFFIHKPTTYIPHSKIADIELDRIGPAAASGSGMGAGSGRQFDLVITIDNGTVHRFTGLHKQEYPVVLKYLVEKKLPVRDLAGHQKNVGNATGGSSRRKARERLAAAVEAENEVSDVDMYSEDSEEGEDSDFEIKQMSSDDEDYDEVGLVNEDGSDNEGEASPSATAPKAAPTKKRKREKKPAEPKPAKPSKAEEEYDDDDLLVDED